MTTDVALMVYSLGGGGVELMRLHLAEGLLKRGYSPAIIVARADGPYRDRIPPGVKLVDLKARSWRAWLDAVTSYLGSEKPRVLLAAMETAGVLALWARRRACANTRVVVSSHVTISRHIQSEPKAIKRIVVPYLVRRLYRHADGIVAVSAGVAADLARFARLPRERIRVIHNPVVTEDLLINARHGVSDPSLARHSCPLILSVGRLTEQKDFATLLRAVALVRKQRGASLMILGDGEKRDSLEGLAHDLGLEAHVSMPGFVVNPAAFMGHASLFVLSSAWEGFGNVLVEALACGCPVVSTDCSSGPSEILCNGRYGRLVPVGDHEGLARAIIATLEKPPDPNFLKGRAMDFHVDKIVDQYLDVMQLS